MDNIICIGEILWDSFPSGQFPGGAPYNVSNMLRQLELNSIIVSRIGDDDPGMKLLELLSSQTADTSWVQVCPEYATGRVDVELDAKMQPAYNILTPAAWDFIEYTQPFKSLCGKAKAIVFGSLAQRHPVSRETIWKLLVNKTIKVFDINLRPPHIDFENIEHSLVTADILKLNMDELNFLTHGFEMLGSEDSVLRQLQKKYDLLAVFLTKGDQGAKMIDQNQINAHPGYQVVTEDPVGAGDAFLAAALKMFFAGKHGLEVLTYANAVAASVAAQKGATPQLNFELINSILDGSIPGQMQGVT